MHVSPNSRIVLLRLRLGGVKGKAGGLQEEEEEVALTNCRSIVSRILSSHRSSRQYRQLVRADVVHDAAEPLLLPDADGVPGMLGVYQRPNACFFFQSLLLVVEVVVVGVLEVERLYASRAARVVLQASWVAGPGMHSVMNWMGKRSI